MHPTPPALSRRTHRRWPIAAAPFLLALGAATADEPFEVPPEEPPSASLPPAQVAGENFHIADPVRSDGLMHHYVVVSRFGDFKAYGRGALIVRLREVAALTSLAKTSDVEVALQSVGRGLYSSASSTVDLVKNPVGAVTGIPKGIKHLFAGYHARAEEVTSDVKKTASDIGQGDGAPSAGGEPAHQKVANEAETQAKRYADHYLGLSGAQMRWYKKLGVDPYTSNEVLRKAVAHVARIESATNVGLRFVPMPGIPYAGEIHRALDTIYNEDPAVLRKRQRETLASYGLTPAEIEHFENSLPLSPTRQTLLLEMAKSLKGVEGVGELFRHAMGVTSEEEVEVFVQSALLLTHFHATTPVARILPGLRLPAAQLADSRVVVFGSFDAVYWTSEVAEDAGAVEQLLPRGGAREVRLVGAVSPRARAELERHGWEVREHAFE